MSQAQEVLPRAPVPVNAAPEALPLAPLEDYEVEIVPLPQIGGETLSQIQLREICRYKGKVLPPAELFFKRASSIFEAKQRVLFRRSLIQVEAGGVLLRLREAASFQLLR